MNEMGHPEVHHDPPTYGSARVDLLHDGLGAVDEAVLGGVVALKVLLGPAVALAPRRAVLAHEAVRLAAVLHLGTSHKGRPCQGGEGVGQKADIVRGLREFSTINLDKMRTRGGRGSKI